MIFFTISRLRPYGDRFHPKTRRAQGHSPQGDPGGRPQRDRRARGGHDPRGEGRHCARLRTHLGDGGRDARVQRFAHRREDHGAGVEPRGGQHRRRDSRRLPAVTRRRRGAPDRTRAGGSRGAGPDGPGGGCAGAAGGWAGSHRVDDLAQGRDRGAGDHPAAAGEGATADGHQGDRLHDPDRPRPARADHRGPRYRQDGHRGRHDHQPEGPRRHLRLRRDRAEELDGRRGGGAAEGARRDGLHHRRRSLRLRARTDAVHRPVRRLHDGRVLHVRREEGHALRLRRSLEAGGGLPAAVARATPSSRARSVSGRRLLPPQPVARARGQALRRRRAAGR